MRCVGIDIGAERHVVAIVREDGAVLTAATPFQEDAEGYGQLRAVMGGRRRRAGCDGGDRALLAKSLCVSRRGRLCRGAAQSAADPSVWRRRSGA